MDVLAIGVLSLVLVPCALAGALAFATRDRWGVDRVPVSSAGGAYRGGATSRVARRIPACIAAASALALVWAAVTGLVFVPAGGALVLIAVDGGAGALAAFTLAIVISGLVHAIALAAAGSALAVRSALAVERARRTATYARVHHTAVLLGFAAAVVARTDEPLAALAALAVPCAVGWLVAYALDAASRELAALPDASLPDALADAMLAGAVPHAA